MTLKEINNKLIGLNTKGIELADKIEAQNKESLETATAYEETLNHISLLLEAKETIESYANKLKRFELLKEEGEEDK